MARTSKSLFDDSRLTLNGVTPEGEAFVNAICP
jgi:hypothetical protein